MSVWVGLILRVAQPATDWLTPFVGAWETVDTYHPVTGAPIVERARRTCEMVMQGRTCNAKPSGGGHRAAAEPIASWPTTTAA